jgi:hypothetical protein
VLQFSISGIYDKFADAFVEACKKLEVGNGFVKGVSLVIVSLSLPCFLFPMMSYFCVIFQHGHLQELERKGRKRQ